MSRGARRGREGLQGTLPRRLCHSFMTLLLLGCSRDLVGMLYACTSGLHSPMNTFWLVAQFMSRTMSRTSRGVGSDWYCSSQLLRWLRADSSSDNRADVSKLHMSVSWTHTHAQQREGSDGYFTGAGCRQTRPCAALCSAQKPCLQSAPRRTAWEAHPTLLCQESTLVGNTPRATKATHLRMMPSCCWM